MKPVPRVISILSIFLIALAPAPASAEEPLRPAETSKGAPSPRDPSWGLQDRVLYHVGNKEFLPTRSGVAYSQSHGRYSISESGEFGAALHLPSGVLLTFLELDYCDMSPTSQTRMYLQVCDFLATTCTIHGILNSNDGQPGCTFRSANLVPDNIVVDNNTSFYELIAVTESGTNDTQIIGAYVGYKLQVSPAPAVATFPNDVPTTHPFFRFVEALARAGITAGCGGNNFCPDEPLTRGQMAVFLSAALGLHFPN